MEVNNHIENKIIEAAQELFMEKGFEKTNMSEIARKAGINRPALHYYFRTKDKMFEAVFSTLVGSFLPHLEDIFAKDIPFMDKVQKVLDGYIVIFTQNPSLPQFILGEVNRDLEHLLETIRNLHFDTYLQSIEKILISEMEKGNLKTVPIPMVMLTFYSQLIFPFLAKPLIMAIFYGNEEEFATFIHAWKKHVMEQVKSLLTA